jgi:DMSO reductase family type II enzyme heme b subunit
MFLGGGYYDKAKRRWHVVFKRSLKVQDEKVDVSFEKRRFVAFAIWNGANGDRGGRKAISNWVELEIEP